ncbi:hypothetical protein KFE25_013830 [Diacronema lutheri]|uniref:Uncharacterized protein n=1 Tax=Diacronema lutheri TaxID=2081491 RepID=A0A8J5XUI9_DIALT|nr:hypothetical protein KFE25_013830 [Diacronema lutheri]
MSAPEQASPLELEHLIGYAGLATQSVQAHAVDADSMIYHASALVIIGSQADPHRQSLLRGHTEDVTCLAQSLDGEYLASGQQGGRGERSGDAWVYVWSYAQRVPIYRLQGLKGKAEAVAFSRDNRFIAGSDEERRLLVWDLQNGQLVNGSQHEAPISCIAWGPVLARESRRGAARPSSYKLAVAAGWHVKEVFLHFNVKAMQYEAEATPLALPASGLVRAYASAAYTAGDAFLLAGTQVGELCVFALAQEPPQPPADAPPAAAAPRKSGVFRACVPVSAGAGGVRALALDGDCVWLGAGDGKVKRFRGSDQSWLMEEEGIVEGRVVALSLCADRRSLLAGTSAGHLYSVDAGSLAARVLYTSHTAAVRCVAFSAASSERVASASADGSVRLWDLSSYAVTFSAQRTGQLPTCLVLGGELGGSGALVLSGWEDGAIFCHDPDEQQTPQHTPAAPRAPNGALPARGLAWSIARAHGGGVSALALSETALVSAGRDAKLRVWGLASRQCEAEFSEHTKPITAMLLDVSQPNIVHTCGQDQLVVSFDLRKKRRLTYHALREGQLTAMVQRPQGELELLTATHDGLVFVWDVDEAAPVGMLREPHGQKLNALALSPSGKYLAVCTEQGAQLQVWDVASGEPGTNLAPIAIGGAHSEAVASAAWSPDERQIVSVGRDGLVAVWNWFGAS